MKWSQITFNDWSAQVVIAGGESKTGINRYVPLVSSRQYLAVWKDHYYTISKTDKFREKYPEGMTQDSFLFLTNNRYQPLHYNNTAKHIRLIATRAGVTKHVTPHIFRHSRITHMLQQGG
ncbi:tyrosine-type recombinase/integrase [Methanogenium cariaci]|uniref:tyrosine-type recombinase/integrase n=1 Tax=Methanogenium cariaci TaxID=2197 RepID=UPI000780A79A|nr:tyrosine-type recombinase/integrase [Methanogenium cariaci]